MNKIKSTLFKIPGLKRLSDWTDTPTGENVAWGIIFLAVIMIVVYVTGK